MKRIRINWDVLKNQQVALVIACAGGAIFLFWYFVLWPLNQKRRVLENNNIALSEKLAGQRYGRDVETRTQRKTAEASAHESLRSQWRDMSKRLAAFPDQKELATAWVGHIDYKRAFHEVSQLLRRKSTTVAVLLPKSLGMSDEVTSDADARKLMLQLRAMEKAVSIALDLKIERITRIAPLPPQPYLAGETPEVFIEEYPVFLSFTGKIDALHQLFKIILKQPDACVFRNIRIEKNDTQRESVLNIDVVLSSLVFTRDLEQLTWLKSVRVGVMNPDGH